MVKLAAQTDMVPALTGAHWILTRLSMGLMLDCAQITRRGRDDVLDPLILTAVVEANVAPINQDARLQQLYGILAAPPPDELRRPVSINAVAQSLGLPFETVRRRIAQLAERGACVVGSKGVVVPAAVLSSPEYAEVAQARYQRLRRFYYDLKALGALAEIPATPGPPLDEADRIAAAAAPVRIANRMLSEYFLRVMEMLMRTVGDPLSGLILMALARANIEHLPAAALAEPGPFPQAERRPVRRSLIAQRLHLPAETVSRRLKALEADGYCRTTPDGVLFLAERVARPEPLRLIHDNAANVQRLFARLARYGVVELWDREQAQAPVPAAGAAA